MNNRNRVHQPATGPDSANDHHEMTEVDENKATVDPEHQKKLDYAELIAFALLVIIQFAFTLLMMSMDFKQFSIIYFFTTPMWILMLEALCLFVVRVCKCHI